MILLIVIALLLVVLFSLLYSIYEQRNRLKETEEQLYLTEVLLEDEKRKRRVEQMRTDNLGDVNSIDKSSIL